MRLSEVVITSLASTFLLCFFILLAISSCGKLNDGLDESVEIQRQLLVETKAMRKNMDILISKLPLNCKDLVIAIGKLDDAQRSAEIKIDALSKPPFTETSDR